MQCTHCLVPRLLSLPSVSVQMSSKRKQPSADSAAVPPSEQNGAGAGGGGGTSAKKATPVGVKDTKDTNVYKPPEADVPLFETDAEAKAANCMAAFITAKAKGATAQDVRDIVADAFVSLNNQNRLRMPMNRPATTACETARQAAVHAQRGLDSMTRTMRVMQNGYHDYRDQAGGEPSDPARPNPFINQELLARKFWDQAAEEIQEAVAAFSKAHAKSGAAMASLAAAASLATKKPRTDEIEMD